MFWVMWAGFFAAVATVGVIFGRRIRNSREYQFRKDAGEYYIEDGKLFLNARFPDAVQAVNLEEIDHVSLDYDLGSHRRGIKYHIQAKIVRKDGSETPTVFYEHSARLRTDPEAMAAGMTAAGLRCVLPTGEGSLLRGNQA